MVPDGCRAIAGLARSKVNATNRLIAAMCAPPNAPHLQSGSASYITRASPFFTYL